MKRVQPSPVADPRKPRGTPPPVFSYHRLSSSPHPPILSAKGKLSATITRKEPERQVPLHQRELWPLCVCQRPAFGALTHVHVLPLQAFESLLQLFEARATYEEFCIPMCMVPATISNNVPGTNLSIGADTALNAIVEVSQAQINTDSRFTSAFERRCAVTSCLTPAKLTRVTPVSRFTRTRF